MKAETLLKKSTAILGSAVLSVALAACGTHRAVDTTNQTAGELRTDQNAQQQASADQTLGTAAAPANTQNVGTPATPAVIPGPAAVDKSGNVYTSSAVGSAGNNFNGGLNTDVNIKSPRPSSSATVTQSAAVTTAPTESTTVVTTTPAPVVTESTSTTTTVETTPAPAPAPVVVETTPAPAPAPTVVETPAPMTSSTTTTENTTTTTTTTTHHKHRRMRKD